MNEDYAFSIEGFDESFPEIEKLYKEHYQEVRARLAGEGIDVSPFNMRTDVYSKASREGWLLTFVVRFKGEAVGYGNTYITHDMHNFDLIAREDALYVTRAHRNGIGKDFMKFGLKELRDRGVKRVIAQAVTDPRVAKLWSRVGFKSMGQMMAYTF